MRGKAPSRLEPPQGALYLLTLRTLLAGRAHGRAIARHLQRTGRGKRARFYQLKPLEQLATGLSKLEALARAMSLILNPADQEAK